MYLKVRIVPMPMAVHVSRRMNSRADYIVAVRKLVSSNSESVSIRRDG